MSKILHTKPAAVGLDSGTGQLLRLKLILQNLAFAVTSGPRIVHLESANCSSTARTIFLIRTIRVQRVLRLTGNVHLLLSLLRHLCKLSGLVYNLFGCCESAGKQARLILLLKEVTNPKL